MVLLPMVWVGAILFMAAGVSAAGEDSSDRRFLTGLRERGLFRLAETYCTDRLADPQLAESRRADLSIELSLTLADRAVSSPPHERPPLWQRAGQAADDFARQHPGSPRLVLVRLQGAMGTLARGELARQEGQVVADSRALVDEAKTHLRSAIGQLEALAEEVQRRLRQSGSPGPIRRTPLDRDGLTDQQLVSLEKNVRYQSARALRNLGACYDAESADRADALTRATGLLEPLARLDAADPLAWRSRIDQIVCDRLLGDYPAAGRRLDALLAENLPPGVALRAQAQCVRLALAAGQLDHAIALMSTGRELDGVSSAELDYAWLETCLEAWREAGRAGDDERAAGFQARATEMVRVIQREHGPFWTRRAEMLLADYVESSPGGGNLQMRVRAAESSYRSGRFDDAAQAYDRARALAEEQGDALAAFQYAYIAATIEHQRDRHPEAMARYRQLALAMPEAPRAAEAHLLAVYHAEQLAKDETPESLSRYVALLEEHIEYWPGGGSADRVYRRLGRLRQHQRDWPKAVAAYRAISADDPQYVEILEAAAVCYRAWLDDLQAAGQPTDSIAAEAADWFGGRIVGPEGRLPERWSPAALAAAVTAARLRLEYAPSDLAGAEALLRGALDGAPDAPPQWTSTARTLLVGVLAARGRRREAAAVLGQISAGPADRLLEMLEGLARMAAAASDEVRGELAGLQLKAAELLQTRIEDLSPAEKQTLQRLEGQALADAGRIGEALAVFGRLSKTYADDGAIQEGYARLLSTREDRDSLTAALVKWREVGERSVAGSDRWFGAKYEIALLHFRLGNAKQAETIIRLLQVLHPELGGPAMKARFLELLERSEKRGHH